MNVICSYTVPRTKAAFQASPCTLQKLYIASYSISLLLPCPLQSCPSFKSGGMVQASIGINCFSHAGFDKLGGFQKDKNAEMLEGIPLQRFGSKWDIAMACIYLASRSASHACHAFT